MKTYTKDEITTYIAGQYEWQAREVIPQVNGWLSRGDGIAVYVNQDLGSRDVGQCRLASFGSVDAMLTMDPLPTTLPDTPSMINWRYQLEGTYSGDTLTIPEDLPEPPDDDDTDLYEDDYEDCYDPQDEGY